MCYYNGIRVSKEEFIRLNNIEKELKEWALIKEVSSGFEYTTWPILKPIKGGADVQIEMAHWELIPGWVKSQQELAESRKKFTTLNATAEKILESKLYRPAALHHRCLVLSSGFYEWRHFKPLGEKKEQAFPYYIHLPGKNYFFMAGIYQPWTDQETGETFDSFSIITTQANSLMEQVHNKKKRMPTILPESLAFEWIQDGLSEARIKELAAYQYDSHQMEAYPISKNFRTNLHPQEAVIYETLPALVQ